MAIDGIEEIDNGLSDKFTSDRSAYPINNLEDIYTVYQREFKTEI